MEPRIVFPGGVLRRHRPEDAPRFAELCDDPAVQRFTRVPVPYDPAHAEAYIARTTRRWEAGQPAPLLAEVDGTVVANVGLVHVDPGDGCGELVYWTAPEARGLGLTTAAAHAYCDWVLATTGLGRLELQTAAGNVGSERVAQRLGFRREGVRRSAAVLPAVDGLPRERADLTVWGLLPGELAPRDAA